MELIHPWDQLVRSDLDDSLLTKEADDGLSSFDRYATEDERLGDKHRLRVERFEEYFKGRCGLGLVLALY
jgi:hypothetical protein